MMPVHSASSYSSTFGFVSHRLLTVIVAFWTGRSSSSDTGYSQSSSDYGCSENSSDSGYSESSSDSGTSIDNRKDDPDWSAGEEEQSGDEELQDDDGHQAEDNLALVVADQGQEMVVADHGQEMEVAEDDLAMVVPEGGLAMVVVPDNDHAPVVAPTIPQLGDMTTPIEVEDYIHCLHRLAAVGASG